MFRVPLLALPQKPQRSTPVEELTFRGLVTVGCGSDCSGILMFTLGPQLAIDGLLMCRAVPSSWEPLGAHRESVWLKTGL